jgi:hypothetical protein
MERAEFRQAVFARDNRKCVVCGAFAVDAHHLMERRLWSDGGYHPDNGVSLCAKCHMNAERTLISPDQLREAAGIKKVLLPPHLYSDERYDKWGNIYLPDGRRLPGELYHDESVQKVIEGEFTHYAKYPRTYHLPWSPGATKDDRVMDEVPFDGREVVITEKMDGENTTMYRDHIHARSLDSGYHVSRNWVKNLHGKIAHEIPHGWRLCGENLAAKHSIHYNNLPGYFLLFSIWNDKNECLSWQETEEWAELLDQPLVPVVMKPQLWTEALEKTLPQTHLGRFSSPYAEESEGYVIRVTRRFSYGEFRNSVGKYVREGHVDETRHHWKNKLMVPNYLKGPDDE